MKLNEIHSVNKVFGGLVDNLHGGFGLVDNLSMTYEGNMLTSVFMSNKLLFFWILAVSIFCPMNTYSQKKYTEDMECLNKDKIGYSSSGEVSPLLENDVVKDDGNQKKPHRLKHDVSIHGGPTSIISEVNVYGDKYNWRKGIDKGLKYHYMFQDNLGLGFTIENNVTHYPSSTINISFFGLSIVYNKPVSHHWNFGGGLDIGKAHYNHDNGVGIETHVGAEYLLCKNVGVSLDGCSFFTLLNDKKRSSILTDGTPGISKIGLIIGLHFHL